MLKILKTCIPQNHLTEVEKKDYLLDRQFKEGINPNTTTITKTNLNASNVAENIKNPYFKPFKELISKSYQPKY